MTGSIQRAGAVVVAIDRLGAGFLGPYGNTWLDTPHFNRLASQSLVCETVLADSPELALAYRAWWTGRHALEPAMDDRPALPSQSSAAGLRSVLVTDEPLVAELPDAAGFDERILVPQEPATAAAEELEQTGMGRLFLTAIDRLSTGSEPGLVWIHSRGMAGPWDAPYALRQQLADEDDPPPPDFVDPPRRHLPREADPDEQLGLVQAYGGQVALADACVGMLLEAFDQLPFQPLLAVTSPRGYPLGEHESVGGTSGLFSELLQVPLLVRPPAGQGSPLRLQQLVQPPDLHATLAAWLGLPGAAQGSFAQNLLPALAGEGLPPRELAYACGSSGWALRTHAWLLLSAVVDDEVYRKLFAKPDDRWEANEVASRCGQIVEQLAAAGASFSQAAAAGKAAELPPLEAALTDARR